MLPGAQMSYARNQIQSCVEFMPAFLPLISYVEKFSVIYSHHK